MSAENPIDAARHMGTIYQDAIGRFMDRLDNFSRAVDLLLAAEGHVVVCGMGKSGLFGRRSRPPSHRRAHRRFSCILLRRFTVIWARCARAKW